MAICASGHIYDKTKFSECPWCRAANGNAVWETRMEANIPGTEPIKTMPISKDPHTAPIGERRDHTEENKTKFFSTVSDAKKNERTDPVAGWLVSCEGVEKGRDYRVHFGQNLVGRGKNMDIVLEDQSVSRDSHLFIIYDYKHNNFVIQSGTSHGLIYRNDHLVTGAEELLSFDRLEIGDSKFIFVALCGEHFKWETSGE
ncbi:MAG: FHA domain-containing protein [Synergistaceae bacterium]|jgi:hypothetical protein|nr:FHA domain-containing protein [Synergistaceae bacterium]